MIKSSRLNEPWLCNCFVLFAESPAADDRHYTRIMCAAMHLPTELKTHANLCVLSSQPSDLCIEFV